MSDAEACSEFSNATLPAGMVMQYLTYHLLLPFYCTVGLTANVILLVAFYRRAKIEKPYAYQVFQAVSKSLEVLAFGTFVLGMHRISAVLTDGSDWFVRSYPLMFITVKIANPAYNHFITCTLLCSVAMSADRAFALYLPLKYKYINHGRHQLAAAVACFTLPAVYCVSFAWDFVIVQEGDAYQIKLDTAFKTGPIAVVCGWVSAAVRMVGVVSLVVLNVAIIVKFRKQHKKVALMKNKSNTDDAKKAAEKALFVLNTVQSVLVVCNQIPHVGIILMVFTSPSFLRCWGVTAPPMVDGCIMVTDSIDVMVIAAINKKLRTMVVNAFKCCERTQVVPTDSNQRAQGNRGAQQGPDRGRIYM